VENYFNYFTEIEERYQHRRGTGLLLSTLDWALIETWKDAGIPLEAVLRGIDAAFDRYEERKSKSKKMNSLAYCSQEVLSAAEDMKEAAVGAVAHREDPGLQAGEIASFLRRNAEGLNAVKLAASGGVDPGHALREAANSLREIAAKLEANPSSIPLEELERRLTVLEEKLFAILLAAVPDDQVVTVRGEAERQMAPYRSKMPPAQVEQLRKQYVHKRMLEKAGIPRLSLFYM
jgi:hypothetical protein